LHHGPPANQPACCPPLLAYQTRNIGGRIEGPSKLTASSSEAFYLLLTTTTTMVRSSDGSMSTKKKNKKAVRFELEHNTCRTFVVPDDIDHGDLWFSATEFDDIKQRSRTESREWRKLYSHLLNETFEHAKPDAIDYLIAFCLMQGDLYRRGLERQCNRQHGEQRSDAKDRTRYLVFETQRRFKTTTTTATTIKIKTTLPTESCRGSSVGSAAEASTPQPDDDDNDKCHHQHQEQEEKLAELYRNSCRHAKLFAHRIAQADEIVALGKMDCAARTQALLTVDSISNNKCKRRGSNLSIQSNQSNDSLDSRLLLMHHYRQQQNPQLPPHHHHHHQHQHQQLFHPLRRFSPAAGGAPPVQPQRYRSCPASPLSLSRAGLAHHEAAYAAIA
jgi:hypothetical protein